MVLVWHWYVHVLQRGSNYIILWLACISCLHILWPLLIAWYMLLDLIDYIGLFSYWAIVVLTLYCIFTDLDRSTAPWEEVGFHLGHLRRRWVLDLIAYMVWVLSILFAWFGWSPNGFGLALVCACFAKGLKLYYFVTCINIMYAYKIYALTTSNSLVYAIWFDSIILVSFPTEPWLCSLFVVSIFRQVDGAMSRRTWDGEVWTWVSYMWCDDTFDVKCFRYAL